MCPTLSQAPTAALQPLLWVPSTAKYVFSPSGFSLLLADACVHRLVSMPPISHLNLPGKSLYYSYSPCRNDVCCAMLNDREIVAALENAMTSLFESFRARNNNQLPDHVIVYRDGVGDGQFDQILDMELPCIRNALDMLVRAVPYGHTLLHKMYSGWRGVEDFNCDLSEASQYAPRLRAARRQAHKLLPRTVRGCHWRGPVHQQRHLQRVLFELSYCYSRHCQGMQVLLDLRRDWLQDV
jgi:hypothetical protein